MLFKNLLDDPAGRLDSELIHPGIDILHEVGLHPGLLKNCGQLIPGGHVAGIDHRRGRPQSGNQRSVMDGGFFLPVIHPAGQQDHFRLDLPQLLQVGRGHLARGDHLDHGAGAQGRLPGRLYRHLVNKPVHAHGEAPGGAGGGHDHVPVKLFRAEPGRKICHGQFQGRGDIAAFLQRGREPLAQQQRRLQADGVDHGGGAPYFSYEQIYFHRCPLYSL